jgi:hypothetical protein
LTVFVSVPSIRTDTSGRSLWECIGIEAPGAKVMRAHAQYVARCKDTETTVKAFMKDHGGVNACASFYTKYFR